MWQYRDRQSKKDSEAPESPWNSAGERVRLSQESGGSLRPIKRESIGRLTPTAVTRESSRLFAAIQEATSAEAVPIQIFLAKIVCFRYIAFICFIRYVSMIGSP